MLFCAAVVAVVLLSLDAPRPSDGFAFRGLMALPTAAFATVGQVIARQQPRNPLGWLYLGSGMAMSVMGFSEQYATWILLAPQSPELSGAVVAAWLASWTWIPPFFALSTFGLLLFPEGRLPSPRWRSVGWAAGAVCVGTTAITAVQPGRLDNFGIMQNPYGVEGPQWLWRVVDAQAVAVLLLVLICAASVVVRARRADAEQYQQIRWVRAAGVVFLLTVVAQFGIDEDAADLTARTVESLILVGIIGLPAAVGIAITRHRLYDLDRIISRTLGYGLASILLVGTYAGLVLVAGGLVGGPTERSDLVVAAATLTVAALFRPVLARALRWVDRRFYRQRYDAQRTIEAFTTRLREDGDLAALRAEVVAVVQETVRPATVELWIPSRSEHARP